MTISGLDFLNTCISYSGNLNFFLNRSYKVRITSLDFLIIKKLKGL